MLWGLALVVVGAAAAIWTLARWQGAAEFLGVREEAPVAAIAGDGPAMSPASTPALQSLVPNAVTDNNAAVAAAAENAQAAIDEIDTLEERVKRLEAQIRRAEGSAGRADALLVAFAARRAVERGVALGYLEHLLVDRFGANYEPEVAQVITSARDPVRLDDLIARYERLGPTLRTGSEDVGAWQRVKRELSSLVAIYPAGQPNPKPRARYDRALVELRLGDVSAALAETMRMPGADSAGEWIEDARRYVTTRRALDRLESAALLSREENATNG